MTTRLYPPLRPQLISEVLDSAFRIFSTSLLKALPYGMLITFAGQLVNIHNLLAGRRARSIFPQDPTGWVLYAVSVVLTLTLWAALLLRLRAVAEGTAVSMPQEIAVALRRLPELLLLTVLNVIAVAAGTLLLVLPGIYIVIALWMSVPLLVLANESPLAAFKSSLQLMRGHWWRTFAIFLVTIAIYFVFILFGIVFAAIVVQLERGADVAVVTATSTVFIISLGAFSAPFIAAMMLAVLGDLTVRRAAVAVVA